MIWLTSSSQSRPQRSQYGLIWDQRRRQRLQRPSPNSQSGGDLQTWGVHLFTRNLLQTPGGGSDTRIYPSPLPLKSNRHHPRTLQNLSRVISLLRRRNTFQSIYLGLCKSTLRSQRASLSKSSQKMCVSRSCDLSWDSTCTFHRCPVTQPALGMLIGLGIHWLTGSWWLPGKGRPDLTMIKDLTPKMKTLRVIKRRRKKVHMTQKRIKRR